MWQAHLLTVIISNISHSTASNSHAGLPDLQLLLLGCERILWAFQCKSWWMGLPVLSGCSGSVSSSSSTLRQGWACCSARQIHTRELSPIPPGMWISVRKHKYTHTQLRGVFRAASHAQMHLFVPKKKKWTDAHGHTPNEQKHHSEPILGTPQSLQTCWIY